VRIIVREGAEAGRVIEVDRELSVGRIEGNDVVVVDPRVSSRHATLKPADGGIELTDTGSTNGTFVDGTRLSGSVLLRGGEEVRIGSTVMVAEPDVVTAAATDPAGATEFAGTEIGELPTPTAEVPAPVPTPPPVAAVPPPEEVPPPAAAAPPPPPPPAPPAEWRLSVRTGADTGRVEQLPDGSEISLGRSPESTFMLQDPRISARHAVVRRQDGKVTVQDLGSANGTYVNGDVVEGNDRREVKAGDEIQLGETIIVVSSGAPGGTGLGPAPTVMGSVPSDVREQSRKSTRNLIIVGVVAVLAAGIAAAIALTRDGGKETRVIERIPATVTEQQVPTTPDIPDIIEKNRTATVRIFATLSDTAASTGSGSVIDQAQGLIITNNHVAGVGQLTVRNATGQEVQARLIAAMPCEDVALVQITNPADRADFTQVEFADPASLSQGEQVLALGYPGTAATARPEECANAQLSATNGIISQTATKYDVPGSDVAPLTDAIQHNAAVNHGNSGGPLFDLEGKQVGINTAIYFANGERLEGENYAISVRRILELIPRLKTGDSQAWLGATFAQYGDEQGNPTAIVTDYLDSQGPLALAGVPAGIAITSINGTDIRTYQDYCAVMKGVGNGSTVELHVVDPNSGKEGELQVTTGRTAPISLQ
jgi:serine protease Do